MQRISIIKPVIKHTNQSLLNTMAYSTQRGVKYKPKSTAANTLSTDDQTNHTQLAKLSCNNLNCETQKCVTLCSTLTELKTEGHFTHKPIVGKYVRCVSDKDANGKDEAQYFVKNKDETKKADAIALNSFKPNKIKHNKKFDTFIKDNQDKFDD